MTPVWGRKVLPAVLAAVVAFVPVAVWSQGPALSESPQIEDPVLKKRRDIRALVSEIREDLLVNHNPQAAKEKCERVLAMDPENPDALFYLGRAERLLKGESGATTRSPVSALPSPELMDQVRKARPTAPVVSLPSDQAKREAGGQASSGWPSLIAGKYLRWAIYGLLALIAVLALLMLFDRLTAGKRQRVAQAELFQRMRAAAEAATPRAGAHPPAIEEPPPDDFPIGPVVPTGELDFPELPPAPAEPASGAAAVAPAADGEEIDYWERKGQKDGPAVAAALAAVALPSESTSGDDVDAISADRIFDSDDLDFDVAPAAGGIARPATDLSDSLPDAYAPASSAGAAPHEYVAESAPRPAAGEEEEEPIVLEGIQIDASTFRNAEAPEEEVAERRELRPHRGFLDDLQVEDPSTPIDGDHLPFSLDGSFDSSLGETQTAAEDRTDKTSQLDSIDGPLSNEPLSLRLDDDHPRTEEPEEPQSLDLSETLARDQDETPLGAQSPRSLEDFGPSEDDLLLEVPEEHQDEILIATGRQPEDQTAPLAGQEVSSESTMVDRQARHKAVFQDQLARGQAAMEKGHWKDAVKYLSVAYAMNPTDEYARQKLQEARQKRDQEMA